MSYWPIYKFPAISSAKPSLPLLPNVSHKSSSGDVENSLDSEEDLNFGSFSRSFLWVFPHLLLRRWHTQISSTLGAHLHTMPLMYSQWKLIGNVSLAKFAKSAWHKRKVRGLQHLGGSQLFYLTRRRAEHSGKNQIFTNSLFKKFTKLPY